MPAYASNLSLEASFPPMIKFLADQELDWPLFRVFSTVELFESMPEAFELLDDHGVCARRQPTRNSPCSATG